MTALNRFKPAVAAAALLVALTQSALAFESEAFDAAAFKAAQDAGKPILVDVFASWCSSCKAQHKAFDTLKAKPEYAGLTVFQVDFDTQVDALKSFAVTKQSTLIAFKGASERARSVGATQTEAIESLLKSAIE